MNPNSNQLREAIGNGSNAAMQHAILRRQCWIGAAQGVSARFDVSSSSTASHAAAIYADAVLAEYDLRFTY